METLFSVPTRVSAAIRPIARTRALAALNGLALGRLLEEATAAVHLSHGVGQSAAVTEAERVVRSAAVAVGVAEARRARDPLVNAQVDLCVALLRVEPSLLAAFADVVVAGGRPIVGLIADRVAFVLQSRLESVDDEVIRAIVGDDAVDATDELLARIAVAGDEVSGLGA